MVDDNATIDLRQKPYQGTTFGEGIVSYIGFLEHNTVPTKRLCAWRLSRQAAGSKAKYLPKGHKMRAGVRGSDAKEGREPKGSGPSPWEETRACGRKTLHR